MSASRFILTHIFSYSAQKMKLRIRSHLLKKSLMENFKFCAVVLGQNRREFLYSNIVYAKNNFLNF